MDLELLTPLTSPSLTPWKRLAVLDAFIDQANSERITIIKDLAAEDAKRGSWALPPELNPTTLM